MRRDGRFEPLTLLAEALCVAGLGLAAGCGLFLRHRRAHCRPVDLAAQAAALAQHRATQGFVVTGPSRWNA